MDTCEKDGFKWARTNSIRVDSNLRSGIRRETDLFMNGIVKKLMIEKVENHTEYSTKLSLERPLSIKKKEIKKKD